jgi:hypothetical protein
MGTTLFHHPENDGTKDLEHHKRQGQKSNRQLQDALIAAKVTEENGPYCNTQKCAGHQQFDTTPVEIHPVLGY